MKKETIESKLKAYSVLAAGVLAAGNTADAQIVYTDIIPDVTNTGFGAYMLDLDNDATSDFRFKMLALVGTGSSTFATDIFLAAMNSNEVLGSSMSSDFYPFALNLNDPINATQTAWSGGVLAKHLAIYSNQGGISKIGGNWVLASDKYLGLRIKISGQWHYGWARLTVDINTPKYTIKDYAYESSPNQGILAGKTITDINENNLSDNISMFTSNKKLFIDFKNAAIENCRVSLLNIVGQELKSFVANNTKMEINVGDLPAGVYVINIFNNESIVSKKVTIE